MPMMMNMNENKFIETINKDGKKSLIQISNIFSITETESGCIIQSIGAPGNMVTSNETIDTINEKIKDK